MIREKINMSDERKVLYNVISNTDFLKSIITILKPSFFEGSYSKKIVEWVIEYYTQYREAPGRHLKEIFKQKQKYMRSEEEIQGTREFLFALNSDVEEITNQELIQKIAINWLKERSLFHLKSKIEECIEAGDITRAESYISNYKRIETVKTDGSFLFESYAEINQAFTREKNVLMRMHGALNYVFGDMMRGDLFSFLGFTGVGKTWWLLYVALEASQAGLNVAFFSLEMDKPQILRRLYRMAINKPVAENEEVYQDVQVPKFLKQNDGKYSIEQNWLRVETIDLQKTKGELEDLKYIHRGEIYVKAYEANVCTIQDINNELDVLQNTSHFFPDLIILDYADILRPTIKADYRHQINDIWKNLKGMAQQRESLVVTASQSNRTGASEDITLKDIAEDYRKITHVSQMILLNQNKKDYEQQIVRLRQGKQREGKKIFGEVVVAQNLDIGAVNLDSKFKSEIDKFHFKKEDK